MNIMNMNMNMNAFLDHSFGTSNTTTIKLASCNPRCDSYKSHITEKLFNRWLTNVNSYKSVRVISFKDNKCNEQLFRITLKNWHSAIVEMFSPINGWVKVFDHNDLNVVDWNNYKNTLDKLMKGNYDTEEISDEVYSLMDEVENDFINTIILLF